MRASSRLSKLLRRAALAPIILALIMLDPGAAAAAAARLRLPPIVEPASHSYHVGKVIFVELVTPDLAAAKRFYGALLGWTFRDLDAGGTAYAEAMLGDRPVAGLFQRNRPAGAHDQSAWLTYFSVRNVDRATETAVHNGAKLLFGPASFADRGREAVLADPEGAPFAVLASTSGDPPDQMVDPGQWIWSSLITRDPGTDAAFYQELFGYSVFALPPGGHGSRFILASGGYARASVNPLPASRPDLSPHWLDYLRVADAQATAERVTALGGRILVAPRAEQNGGTIALFADPLGAVFGVIQWPQAPGKEAPQ